MRFWDSSAVVPLLLRQPETPRSRWLFDEDPDMVVWWGTAVECASAVARLAREGVLDAAAEAQAFQRLDALRRRWHEMLPGDGLRAQALRAVRVHPLRAADALQLAAGLDWSGTPASGGYVTFDERLAEAATREGFTVAGR
ncbi:MAG: type II toxin-antitoxin system VapC family toxin [Longimicrobiales bacterium]